MTADRKGDRHQRNPLTFRPPPGDRIWLEGQAARTGRSAGAILSDALALYRREAEAAERAGRQAAAPAAPDGGNTTSAAGMAGRQDRDAGEGQAVPGPPARPALALVTEPAGPAAEPVRAAPAPRLPRRITDSTTWELVKAPDYADSGSWLVMVGGVRAGLVRRAYEGTGSGHVWEAVDNSLVRVHCYGKGATPGRNARTRGKAAAELLGMLRRRQRDAR